MTDSNIPGSILLEVQQKYEQLDFIRPIFNRVSYYNQVSVLIKIISTAFQSVYALKTIFADQNLLTKNLSADVTDTSRTAGSFLDCKQTIVIRVSWLRT